jgi:predicted metal-dependent hydrolase
MDMSRHEVPMTIPRPRDPGLDFTQPLPRYWFGGNPVATHLANGINLLFPAGERFFVRSVSHYLPELADDAELLARVRGFAGQEGLHAGAHERFFQVMRDQGYRIDGFLSVYQWAIYRLLEPLVPPALRLAATAAAEHFTATLAEGALGSAFEVAHPLMARLLRWHAAEEIEHKDVAFDVLERIDPRPGMRMAGMALATVVLGVSWMSATAMLLVQDGLGPAEIAAHARRARQRDDVLGRVFVTGIRRYLRPGFHPRDIDNVAAAREYLASVGLEPLAA